MYKAFLSAGAIRPIYSVILGDPAISPKEKTRMATIVNNTFWKASVNDIPAAQTRKPDIMERKGFIFMTTLETST